METEGGEILGYWSTARLKMQIVPEIIRTMDITIAFTGRFINVLAIILEQGCCDRLLEWFRLSDPFRAGRVIFVFRIPVRDRCPDVLLFSLFPAGHPDGPAGIPVSSCHKRPA